MYVREYRSHGRQENQQRENRRKFYRLVKVNSETGDEFTVSLDYFEANGSEKSVYTSYGSTCTERITPGLR